MAYWLYNLALTAGAVFALPLLPVLFLLGKRFHAGLLQRLGWHSNESCLIGSGGQPIWVHGSSVGEVLAARVLTREIKQRCPDEKIVLSTFTHSGQVIARTDAHADLALYLPLDFLWSVRATFRRLQPAVLVLVETEIWPNLVREAYRRGIPTVLVSGRISKRAFKRYRMCAWFFRRVVQCFTALGMQSETDAQRIIELGADPSRVSVTGSLKEEPTARTAPGGRSAANESAGEGDHAPLWVVGSSHRGEEEVILSAFLSLKKSFPRLRMALAPRHPQRFPEVERLLISRGVEFEKKTGLNGALTCEKDVTFVDTLGDLTSFYGIGDLAFVGGSLVDAGGHNLLEPARCQVPVLFGPYVENFAAVAAQLKASGGGIEVRGAEDLVREISALLSDPEKRRAAGAKAYEVVAQDRRVVERNSGLVLKYLPSTSQRQ